MRIYEFKREKRIEEITELLKNMAKDGEPIDKRKILTAITVRYNVSKKTAGDYLAAAQYKNEQS